MQDNTKETLRERQSATHEEWRLGKALSGAGMGLDGEQQGERGRNFHSKGVPGTRVATAVTGKSEERGIHRR